MLQRLSAVALALVLAFAYAANAAAQERRVQNRPYIDDRLFHYGFFVGLCDQGLDLRNNGYTDPETGAQWMAENDAQNPGFSVGIVGDWKLSRWLSLRATPGLHFGSKHLKFRNATDNAVQTEDMKSCYVGVPVLLKVNGERFNNHRPYVTFGVAPMYDLTSGKQSLLRAKPFCTYLEVGLGCDFYLPFFKLIPELKFSFGLQDVLDRKRNDLTDASRHVFTKSVKSATNNMVTLCFYFE